jgi:signal transduction histidine kinase
MTGPSTIVVLSRSSHTQMAARRAALFFFVAGVLAIVDSLLLSAAKPQQFTFGALGILDLAIAVVLYLLPWARWPARALLVIVPLALVVIDLFYYVGATPLAIYPIFFILLFIWVGLSLPPWMSLVLTPLSAAAYVLPLLWPGSHAAPIDSAVVAVPVCTLIGEVIAHMTHRLRIAQEALEQQVAERTAELRMTNTALQHELVERKQAEVALAAERASLAQRVEERTADLRAANAQLAHAARLKDEFLANMSHELRTPLNTILGMAETLQEAIFGTINAEQIDALQHIEESGRHLLALINDILDLSKVEAGKLELDIADVAIAPLCQASLRLVKQSATQKRLSVGLTIDSTVSVLRADPRRLKQMLVNLLSNAVKFSAEGGAIGLEVLGVREAQEVDLTVWDGGIGIAAEELGRLFQPFVQLDSGLAREYNGSGLGLALVERMARLHGGRVRVESALGQGSRFTITLPWMVADAPSDPRDANDREMPSAEHGVRISLARDIG